MAWTAPRTWTDGELVTAAIMNPHIRDNLLMLPRLLAYKSADESTNTDTTLSNDAALLFALGATETWSVCVGVSCIDVSGSADIKIAFTLPASATMQLQAIGRNPANAFDDFKWSVSGTSQSLRVATAGQFYVIAGHVTTAGTSGNFTMQWAQNTSNASNTTVRKGSNIFGVKMG